MVTESEGSCWTAAVDIKIPKKSTEYFSLKRVKTNEGIPINLSLILLTEERASPPTSFAMRERIELHLTEAPKLHSPILIAELPDSGCVAKIVPDNRVKPSKAS